MSRLQPRPKAQATTSNISSQDASATRNPLSRSPASRRDARITSTDALSDRATLFLIRRTLCSQLGDKGRSTPAPIDEILPPLTSSNEVDLQLYAIISIIIREFVQSWYNKVTPDQLFVEEVVKIIAHCTRALEQRLRNVDLESLLLDELPDLLDVHIQGTGNIKVEVEAGPFMLTETYSISGSTSALTSASIRSRSPTNIPFAVPVSGAIPHSRWRPKYTAPDGE